MKKKLYKHLKRFGKYLDCTASVYSQFRYFLLEFGIFSGFTFALSIKWNLLAKKKKQVVLSKTLSESLQKFTKFIFIVLHINSTYPKAL